MSAYSKSIGFAASAAILMNMFQRFIKHRYPIPPLLYLEWLLLAFMLVLSFGNTVLPAHWFLGTYHSLWAAVLIVLFGWTGLFLPIDKPLAQKVGYTCLELVLISLFLLAGGLRGLFLPYLILIIRSCLLFDIVGQLSVLAVVWLCSFVAWNLFYRRVLLLQPNQLENILMSLGVLFLIMFLLSLLFVLVMMNSLIKERKSMQDLAAAHQQLRQYSFLVEEQSKLQERHRIARDIHDSLGHSLTGLNLQLEAALNLWTLKPDTAHELVGESRQLAKASLQDVRHVIRELRPQNRLQESLKKLTKKVMRWSELKVDVVFEGSRFIPTHMQTEVYHVVQEALNNVVKHASATQVDIRLEIASALVLTIQDDGKGFEVETAGRGFGLTGMRERIRGLEGTFQIQSARRGGTIIRVTIPLLAGES